MKGMLFVVSTPLGNLGDITLRALEVLRSVDRILCEDTRVTAKLLAHFQVQKPLTSYHHHSDEAKIREIKILLEQGSQLALVTDAGTPGISDPGNELVQRLTAVDPTLSIVPIPGPSAVVTALSVSGFPTDKFLFLGFPPHKNKRKKFFEEVAEAHHTVVFYESSHRIKKCLQELAGVLSPDRQICICRELTKKFESLYRGTISQIAAMDISDKGEFVIVISKT